MARRNTLADAVETAAVQTTDPIDAQSLGSRSSTGTLTRADIIRAIEALSNSGDLPEGADLSNPNLDHVTSLVNRRIRGRRDPITSVPEPRITPISALNDATMEFMNGRVDQARRQDSLRDQMMGAVWADASRYAPPTWLENLTPKQKWLRKQFETRKTSLIGETVRAVKDVNGNEFIPPSSLIGTIVSFRPQNGDRIENTEFVVQDPVDSIHRFLLYQIEPVRSVEVDNADLKAATLERIKNMIISSRQPLIGSYQSRVRQDTIGVEERKKWIEEKEKSIKEVKEKIENFNKDEATVAGILEQIEMCKKLEMVEDIYLTDRGSIVIHTKDTPIIVEETDKKYEPETMLGRMIYKIDYFNSKVGAINVDWRDHNNYCHPHIEGRDHNTRICWGKNEVEITEMFKEGKIFQIVDFMCTFFTIFWQRNAVPFRPYDEWLSERVPAEQYQSANFVGGENKLT